VNVKFLVTFVIVLLLYAAGCTSPETTRARGGGPGADIGNRGPVLRMHEGARPFEDTPRLIDAKHPPLDPAYQADELSRRHHVLENHGQRLAVSKRALEV
jgi:hypothetical protein